MTTIAAQSHASLRYLDSDGTGIPDGFVAVRVSSVGWGGDDGRTVWSEVEIRAVGIDDDGMPARVHVRERLMESCEDGTERELASHDVDLGIDDPAATLAVLAAATQGAGLASR